VTRQPFAGERRAVIVVPAEDPTLGGEAELLELEKAEFEAELGTAVAIATDDPRDGPRWLLRLDGDPGEPATISFDQDAGVIVSRAADVGGLFESVNLWRTLARTGARRLAVGDLPDVEAAVARIEAEVADTYPSFELHGLDWSVLCARHADRARAAGDPLPALQRWLAELHDGHTWVWVPVGNLPYAIRVDGDLATFARVPEGTAGFAAGVRPGWRLTRSTAPRLPRRTGWPAPPRRRTPAR